MNNLQLKHQQQSRRVNRIRAVVRGTGERPRLSVSLSNRRVSAQIVNDENGTTLVAVNSKLDSANLTNQAAAVGTEIATAAKGKKIKQVVLDRRGHRYHGRVKALAEAARKAGLEF